MADETAEVSYTDRTTASIAKNCAVRNIVEVDGVLAELATKLGKPVREMNDSELKRLNRDLPEFLTAYLGGAKRRGTKPAAAAAPEKPKRKRGR